MKTLFITVIFLIIGFLSSTTNAQVKQAEEIKTESKIDSLQQQKQAVEKFEKEKLRQEVEEINEQLQAKEITSEEAEAKKKAAAKKRALNIENQLDILDAQIELVQRNTSSSDAATYYSVLGFHFDNEDLKKDRKPKRTYSGFFLAFGLNNVLVDGTSLDDSPYKVGGSRFFEIGYEFSTALIEKGWLRLNYGLSFQFNGLKMKDNHYLVDEGETTSLQPFEYDLDKSKFRMDNVVIPLHLEFGKTNKKYYADSFKVGLGGYAGVNLRTVQKLKYKKNGHHQKDKISGDFNTRNFMYGLSAYVGYDWVALYFKYDLNTIFKNNPRDENNVSAGLRFTL